MKNNISVLIFFCGILFSCNSEDDGAKNRFGTTRVIKNPKGTFITQYLDSAGMIEQEHLSFDSVDNYNQISRYFYSNGMLNETSRSVSGKADGRVVYYNVNGELSHIDQYVMAGNKLHRTQVVRFSPEGYLIGGYLIAVTKHSKDTIQLGENFDVEFTYLNPPLTDFMTVISGYNHEFTDFVHTPDTIYSDLKKMNHRCKFLMEELGWQEINLQVSQYKMDSVFSSSRAIHDYYRFKVFVK